MSRVFQLKPAGNKKDNITVRMRSSMGMMMTV